MKEFRDEKKATSHNFSATNGESSWENTTDDEHENLKGAMTTNDLAEQSFGLLTHQVERFNRIGFGNAAATAQAKMNNDFDRKELEKEHADGAFHQLDGRIKHSLIMTSLKFASQARRDETEALKKQSQCKLDKKNALKKANILKATEEYAKALVLLEAYHSPACWKSVTEVETEYEKLTSETAKREAIKLQINIRVKGLGWKQMHHPWSKLSHTYTGDELKNHLVNKILPFEFDQNIPEVPAVDLPTRQKTLTFTLGTVSHDVQCINKKAQTVGN